MAVIFIFFAIAPAIASHVAEWHFAAITNSNVGVALTDLTFSTPQTHA
jgi:hypothetical protein